jgi:hypothetical protein
MGNNGEKEDSNDEELMLVQRTGKTLNLLHSHSCSSGRYRKRNEIPLQLSERFFGAEGGFDRHKDDSPLDPEFSASASSVTSVFLDNVPY